MERFELSRRVNDLLPFQGSPFGQLGYISKNMIDSSTICTCRILKIRQRRGWDSNPRALADKRFSRPPRYDHFDTSPSICALTARKLYYHSKFQSVNKEKRFSPFLLFFRARQSHVLKQGSSYAVSYLSSDAL